MTRARTKRALSALGLALLALAASTSVHALRIAREGSRAVALCDDALARGERPLAIAHAKAAAEAVPFQASAEGFRRLETIADDAETRGDDRAALAAWRAVRSAALATRGSAALRRKAEAKLAERGARLAEKERLSSGEARVTETSLADDLAFERPPSALSSILLGAGAVAFLSGAVGYLRVNAVALSRRSALALAGAGALLCVLGAAVP